MQLNIVQTCSYLDKENLLNNLASCSSAFLFRVTSYTNKTTTDSEDFRENTFLNWIYCRWGRVYFILQLNLLGEGCKLKSCP